MRSSALASFSPCTVGPGVLGLRWSGNEEKEICCHASTMRDSEGESACGGVLGIITLLSDGHGSKTVCIRKVDDPYSEAVEGLFHCRVELHSTTRSETSLYSSVS